MDDCQNRIQVEIERRPGNVLAVEMAGGNPRCRLLVPPNWKGDATAARWLLSGGSPLVFGRCCSCKEDLGG